MPSAVDNSTAALPKEDVLAAFRLMLTSRRVDDKEVQLKQQNLCFFQISGAGHEAIQVAAARHLDARRDWFFTYYRDRALVLALGATPYEMFLSSVGAEAGPDSHGRQMPSHFGQKRLHCPVGSSPTGTQCLQAAGFAQAGRYALALDRGRERFEASSDEVVWVSLGDGTTSQGEFWESINTACTLRLPLLFVVEDNGYAISTTVGIQTPGGSISKAAAGLSEPDDRRGRRVRLPRVASWRCGMPSAWSGRGRGPCWSTPTWYGPTPTRCRTTSGCTSRRRSAHERPSATRSSWPPDCSASATASRRTSSTPSRRRSSPRSTRPRTWR